MRNYFLDIAEEKNKKQKAADIPSVIIFGNTGYPSEVIFDYTITIPTLDIPDDAIQIPIDVGINMPPCSKTT